MCHDTKQKRWLDDNFPMTFRRHDSDKQLHFLKQVCKADVCTSLNVDTIIDDSNIDCGICRYMGIEPIHFGGYDDKMYPWCYEDETTVTSWVELYKKNLL
jgi:hypothetical protein